MENDIRQLSVKEVIRIFWQYAKMRNPKLTEQQLADTFGGSRQQVHNAISSIEQRKIQNRTDNKVCEDDKQFTITLSERQLKLLAYACRVTDRLILGQLNFSLQECCEAAFEKLHKNDGKGEIGSDEWNFMRYQVTEAIQTLRKLCWGVGYCENHGLGYDNTADILFDMQKVIEHALWLEKDPKNRSNWTNDAFEHTSHFGEEKNIKVNKS